MCQRLWKLAGSRQSYCKNYQAYFFGPPCIVRQLPYSQCQTGGMAPTSNLALCAVEICEQESWAIAKMTEMHPIYGCPENFRESLTAQGNFPGNFKLAFVPIDRINVSTKFELHTGSFTCSWDDMGTQKMGSPWTRPRSLFCKIFTWPWVTFYQ